jgi:MOSC domain-containing protein YiiM
MTKLGIVKGVFSADINHKGMPRPQKDEIELIFEHGIKDDKFAGKNLDQTVMIIGLHTYDIAKQNGIDLEYGSFGENILLDFDPHTLDENTTLFINGAEVELTYNCSICKHLKVFDSKLPNLVKDIRGVYFKVNKSGTVHENTPVYIKDKR